MLKTYKRVLFSLLVVATTAFSMVRENLRGRYREATLKICDLVETHYYRARESDVQSWLQVCRTRAHAQPDFPSKDEAIGRINQILEALSVSHLMLYTPDENRRIWENEAAVDTGLRARWVEELIVVSEVIVGSPGERAGVKNGDVILSVDGIEVGTPDEVENTSGLFSISRDGERLEVKVIPESLILDLRPRKIAIDKNNLVVRLQSFLAQYFDQSDWREFARDFARFQHIVVDLRGNAGGSFPATLRALSAFHCQPTEIGFVYGSAQNPLVDAKGDLEDSFLSDILEVDSQLVQLAKHPRLFLRTFPGYPCYSGKVTVLTDSETNSMAEIFAESFLSRSQSRVWGQATAGQVVMAQWFPVTGFGVGDFSLSIPIAGYMSQSGLEIEGHGLTPQRLLVYDRARMLKGTDPWLADALETPFKE